MLSKGKKGPGVARNKFCGSNGIEGGAVFLLFVSVK